jgi:uncharacterized protein (DUF3084 family)
MAEGMQIEMKKLLDLTTRVDERVKLIVERQQEMHSRLNQFADDHNELTTRVSIVESNSEDLQTLDQLRQRITMLEAHGSESLNKQVDELEDQTYAMDNRIRKIEEHNAGLWGKINKFLGLLVHGIWIIVVCYLLYKMGINTPPIP